MACGRSSRWESPLNKFGSPSVPISTRPRSSSFSESLYWYNLNQMYFHWHPTVTPHSAPLPVGAILSVSKLPKAWSLFYYSAGVEKCYWNPHCDSLLPPPPISASDKVLLWDLLLKISWQFVKSEGTMVCEESSFCICLRKGLVTTQPWARDASLGWRP